MRSDRLSSKSLTGRQITTFNLLLTMGAAWVHSGPNIISFITFFILNYIIIHYVTSKIRTEDFFISKQEKGVPIHFLGDSIENSKDQNAKEDRYLKLTAYSLFINKIFLSFLSTCLIGYIEFKSLNFSIVRIVLIFFQYFFIFHISVRSNFFWPMIFNAGIFILSIHTPGTLFFYPYAFIYLILIFVFLAQMEKLKMSALFHDHNILNNLSLRQPARAVFKEACILSGLLLITTTIVSDTPDWFKYLKLSIEKHTVESLRSKSNSNLNHQRRHNHLSSASGNSSLNPPPNFLKDLQQMLQLGRDALPPWEALPSLEKSLPLDQIEQLNQHKNNFSKNINNINNLLNAQSTMPMTNESLAQLSDYINKSKDEVESIKHLLNQIQNKNTFSTDFSQTEKERLQRTITSLDNYLDRSTNISDMMEGQLPLPNIEHNPNLPIAEGQAPPAKKNKSWIPNLKINWKKMLTFIKILMGVLALFFIINIFRRRPLGKISNKEFGVDSFDQKEALRILKKLQSQRLPPKEEIMTYYNFLRELLAKIIFGNGNLPPPLIFSQDLSNEFPHISNELANVTEIFSKSFYGSYSPTTTDIKTFRKSLGPILRFFLAKSISPKA